MTKEKIQHNFFFVLVAIISGAALIVLSPYFTVLFLAIIFAIMFDPAYKQAERAVRGKRGIAAALTTMIVALAVIVPVVLIGYLVFGEAVQIYASLSANTNAWSNVMTTVRQYVPGLADMFGPDLGQYAGAGAKWFAGHLGVLFSNAALVAMNFILILFTLFFLFKDRDILVNMLISASPLQEKHNKELLDRIARSIGTVTKGVLLIALIQGVESGIGFMLVGIPNAILWGVVAAIAALVPALGTGLVVGPIAIYLLMTGKVVAGIMLAAGGFVIINATEGFLRPILIGRGTNVHPLLVLFSALGGLQIFGLIGFLLGPIIMAILFAMFEMYPSIMQEQIKKGSI